MRLKSWLILFPCLVLLFIWSLPGVTALRHVMLLLALAALMSCSSVRLVHQEVSLSRWPFIWLAILTGWLFYQAVFISPETSWALGELRGQWLIALLAMALGILLAATTPLSNAKQAFITASLMTVFLLQTVIVIVQSVMYWIEHGALLRYQVPLTGGKLEMSYLINILLAALTVDLIQRGSQKEPLLDSKSYISAVAVILSLWCLYIVAARNGVLGVFFLSISALVLFLLDRYRRYGVKQVAMLGSASVLVLGIFFAINYQGDVRWQSFKETAALAWDIDKNRAWVDRERYPLPNLENGNPVDESAYLRIAFIHAGMRLVEENPLGVGYGRNAFAHAIRQNEETRVGHAHSGIVDLAIGGGIPALLLWSAFMVSLMLYGGVRYFRHGNPHGLFLLLLATGYSGRMVLDSVNRDHMLQIFFFLTGYLLIASRPRQAG